MPAAIVEIDPDRFRNMMLHLLPADSLVEEAAFLFARLERRGEFTLLRVVDGVFVEPDGFETRSPYFLELSDSTRASIIKHAHDLQAAIIEVHSHPGGFPRFSWSDKLGLSDFVPHVRWRLRGRPYAAIVVAPSGCDGVSWLNASEMPDRVLGITAGDRSVLPSGWSWRHWTEIDDGRPVHA